MPVGWNPSFKTSKYIQILSSGKKSLLGGEPLSLKKNASGGTNTQTYGSHNL